MEHRREPYINQPDQGRLHQRRGGSHQHAIPIVGFRSGNGPIVDRGNLNGDDLHFGIRRRRTRSSQSEEEMLMGSLEAAGAFGSYGSPVAHGEPQTWYTRSSGQEQAESAPQRRVANTGNATLSSSPRNQGHQGNPGNQKTPGHQGSPGNQKTAGHQGSPGNQKTPGHQGSPGNQGNQSFKGSRTLTFHSKRPNGQHQKSDDEYGSSPGTPRHQSSKGRVRSTSESEPYGMSPKGRGAPRRRRGNSETEGRPQRDNINMSGLQCLAQENIWLDKPRYDEAEKRFYEGANGSSTYPQEREASAILQEIAKARQNIQQSLDGVKTALQGRNNRPLKRQHRNSSHANGDHDLVARMKSLELENNSLHKVVQDMRAVMMKLESRVAVLEKQPKGAAAPVPSAKPAPVHQAKDDDDDDDIDLFGSDSEDDAEAERIKQERVAAYTAKKSKKPALIAKSSILLDVKPWDDETDMAKLEECVRSVQADGLLWGQSKLVPVGYGIKKLQINCVVEDDKVGTDMLEEEITKYEDYVQSVDVAAFNKI